MFVVNNVKQFTFAYLELHFEDRDFNSHSMFAIFLFNSSLIISNVVLIKEW